MFHTQQRDPARNGQCPLADTDRAQATPDVSRIEVPTPSMATTPGDHAYAVPSQERRGLLNGIHVEFSLADGDLDAAILGSPIWGVVVRDRIGRTEARRGDKVTDSPHGHQV